MKEINRHLAEIDEKLLHLKTSLDQADRRNGMLEMVVSWLLARHPDSDEFLSLQADALRERPDFDEEVALLDYLRGLSCPKPVLHDGAQHTQSKKPEWGFHSEDS